MQMHAYHRVYTPACMHMRFCMHAALEDLDARRKRLKVEMQENINIKIERNACVLAADLLSIQRRIAASKQIFS